MANNNNINSFSNFNNMNSMNNMNNMGSINNPRPNLPSLLDAPKPTQTDPSGAIRLPPISFLSNISQMPKPSGIGMARLFNDPHKQGGLPSLQPMGALGVPSVSNPSSKSPLQSNVFPFNANPVPATTLPLKEDITKPDVESASSDEDIIKYYETKYEINDFTAEEKHDILQHERRARIEKQKNPNYKTYLCYSIIKRINNVKEKKPAVEELVKQEQTHSHHPSLSNTSNTVSSEEDIIKMYESKYGYNDFTPQERYDILQHEERERVEKLRNPNYRSYLPYSIVKRINRRKSPEIQSESVSSQVSLPSLQPQSPGVDRGILQTSSQTTNGAVAPPIVSSPSGSLALATAGSVSTELEQQQQQQEQQQEQTQVKFSIRPTVINNDDVLQYASKFPRKHIGSLLYNPFPTKSTYKQLQLYRDLQVTDEEDKKVVPLLPELREHVNSIVTVRIPSWQITDLQNNSKYQERAIWGTDIYTDDSDVLLILKHNGFLPQVDPEVEGEEKTMEKRTPGNKDNLSNITQTVSNFRQFVNIIGGDVHVDLIILPPLVEYAGVFRNGVNSRPWKLHDGMSIAVYGVRYGEKGSAVESMNNVDLKKRKLDELEELRNSEGSHQGKWKLNKEAWKKAKLEMELEKTKSAEKVQS